MRDTIAKVVFIDKATQLCKNPELLLFVVFAQWNLRERRLLRPLN